MDLGGLGEELEKDAEHLRVERRNAEEEARKRRELEEQMASLKKATLNQTAGPEGCAPEGCSKQGHRKAPERADAASGQCKEKRQSHSAVAERAPGNGAQLDADEFQRRFPKGQSVNTDGTSCCVVRNSDSAAVWLKRPTQGEKWIQVWIKTALHDPEVFRSLVDQIIKLPPAFLI